MKAIYNLSEGKPYLTMKKLNYSSQQVIYALGKLFFIRLVYSKPKISPLL